MLGEGVRGGGSLYECACVVIEEDPATHTSSHSIEAPRRRRDFAAHTLALIFPFASSARENVTFPGFSGGVILPNLPLG